MTELLIFKEKIKSFYGKYDIIIDHVIKFLAALVSLCVINAKIGYNDRLSSGIVVFLASLVSAFLPGGLTAVVCAGFIILNLVSMSLEYAGIALLMFLLMFLLYFIFSPKCSYILLLVPVLFFMNIPYAAPILIGLATGLVGVIPVIFGIYIFFMMDFAPEFANAAVTFGEDGIIQKIVYIVDNTIMNKELIVLGVVFAATIILVYIIKTISIDYSWMIAIITGGIVETILVIMSYLMLSLEFSMLLLVLGVIVAVVLGVVLHFFVFAVDYSRTEYVQFEDDDYYYYVKAVPKYSVAKAEVKIKKINERVEEQEEQLREIYEEANNYDEDEEEELKKLAYEQDVEELEDEEEE